MSSITRPPLTTATRAASARRVGLVHVVLPLPPLQHPSFQTTPPPSPTMASSSMAQKTFELNNDIKPLDPADEIFLLDVEEQKKLVKEAPWKKE